MKVLLEYSDIDSPIHRLTGATKLIALILWAIASMITYDTRVLIAMFLISLVIFKISKIKFSDVSFVMYFIIGFALINSIFIFLFSPYQGVEIYGSRTDLIKLFGSYSITLEQLFYQFNFLLKSFSIIPVAILFIVTTNPSEFAASLNKIGVSYKISYSVAIALRYVPDIQRDYQDISFAQQARGIDISKKASFINRIKNSANIIMPLIFSSLERIEVISSAMELRGFGAKSNRTWYSEKSFKKSDYIAIALILIMLIISIAGIIINKGRFYNPFI